jgi:hypothetical protein
MSGSGSSMFGIFEKEPNNFYDLEDYFVSIGQL